MYGDKRNYRPIEIYVSGVFQGVTTWSKTLKEAKAQYFKKYNVHIDTIKCYFSKKG